MGTNPKIKKAIKVTNPFILGSSSLISNPNSIDIIFLIKSGLYLSLEV